MPASTLNLATEAGSEQDTGKDKARERPLTRTIEAELELRSTLMSLSLVADSEPIRVGHDGRYALHHVLGRGAMGTVYLAEDLELRREVALKVVATAAHKRGEFELRLRREAWALALLDHPNVVQIHDVDTSEAGELFIVMQYVPGQTLREWAAQTARTTAELLEVFAAAGEGLLAAHDKGLIHRDFKPDNVFVDASEGRRRVLVGDFGLAGGPTLRAEDEARVAALGPELGHRVHSTRALLGTPAYMPPEQRRREPVGPRSDQYAFCVSMWELLTGERPPLEGAPPARGLPRPRSLAPWLHRLLCRGLSPDPEDRFEDMRALLSVMERAPRRRATARVLGVGAVVIGSLALGRALLPAPQAAAVDPCAAVTDDFDAVWTPLVSARLYEQLRSLGASASDGEAIAAHARATLERAAATFRSQRRQLCESPPPDPLVQKLELDCFHRWQRRFTSHVERLSSVGPDDLVHVPELLAPISSAQLCQAPPPALDGEIADLLDAAEDAELLADFGDALEFAEQADELAQASRSCVEGPYSYERGAAAYRIGHIHSKRDQPASAIAALDRAIEQATACGHDELARDAHLRAVKTAALDLADPERAARHLGLASALIARAELASPAVAFEREAASAALAYARGDYEGAREAYVRALAEIDGQDPLLEAEARIDIATMAQLSGDTSAAVTFYQSAREHLEATLGPAYAAEKTALISLNLGLAMLASGERVDAERQLEAASGARAHKVAIRAHAGLVQLSLIGAGQDERERERAVARAEALLARLDEASDIPALDRGYALFYAGQALASVEREEGLEVLEDALALWRETAPEHELRYSCQVFVAWYLELLRQDHAGSRALLDEALAHMPATHPDRPNAAALDAELKKIMTEVK